MFDSERARVRGPRRARGWPLLAAMAAAVVVLPIAVAALAVPTVREVVGGPSTAGDGTARAGASFSLPAGFAGWRRSTGAGVTPLENDPFSLLVGRPDDLGEFYRDAAYREYGRGHGRLTVLHLTTTGDFRDQTASSPRRAADTFLAEGGAATGRTTMSTTDLSAGLVCGETHEPTRYDLVLCAYCADDVLLGVTVEGTGGDVADAAELTRQLVAAAGG